MLCVFKKRDYFHLYSGKAFSSHLTLHMAAVIAYYQKNKKQIQKKKTNTKKNDTKIHAINEVLLYS